MGCHTMKTLLVFFLGLLPVAAALVLDAQRLDAAGWIAAYAVAGLLVVAHGDAVPRRRAGDRRSRFRSTPGVAGAERSVCVLCGAPSS
jgi:hypothetical protein